VNEPKKRGRPSKAEIAAREPASGGKIATFTAPAENVRKLDPNEPIQIYVDPLTTKLAQLYAERIWNGQSPSAMDTKERIQRVREALQGQGLPCDGVELPGGFKL
jgi:hypothetical protein